MRVMAKKDSLIDQIIHLICAFDEVPRVNTDRTITIGAYTKVKCKPVIYVRPEVFEELFKHFQYSILPINYCYFPSTQGATFMGVEVRVVCNSDAAKYALAFEPVEEQKKGHSKNGKQLRHK